MNLKPAHNRTYKKLVVQCLSQAIFSYQNFCLVDSEVLRDRQVLVTANRCKHSNSQQNMKQTLTFLSFLLLLIQSSCLSIHKGNISSNSFSIKDNFNIISTIEGNSRATYILGIGGNLREGLINEAKKDMYQKYKLQPNQNLTNITTDIKMTYFIFPLIYMSQKVIVSADVIRFYKDNELSISNDKNTNNTSITDKTLSNEININNLSVLKTKSKDEIKIDSVINAKNKILETYESVNDVKIGDIVRLSGFNNEDIFGVVFEISNNKIKMKTYPSPGQVLTIEEKYSWFKKVIL